MKSTEPIESQSLFYCKKLAMKQLSYINTLSNSRLPLASVNFTRVGLISTVGAWTKNRGNSQSSFQLSRAVFDLTS